MNYEQIIKNAPNKSQERMWKSVSSISKFLESIEDICPDMVRDFLLKEYESYYDGHFNECMAREAVTNMHHKVGETNISGEMVPYDECITLLDGDNRKFGWDAYVGVNAFAHDLARANLTKEDLMATAYEFWFADDDFPKDKSKVWWYFRNK